MDKLPKLVEITDQSAIASRRSTISPANKANNRARTRQEQQQNRTAPIRNLTYNVKFECGTISGDEGPLRRVTITRTLES